MSGAAHPTQARATSPPLGTSSLLASLPIARARCPSAAAMVGAKLLEQAICVVRIKTGGTRSMRMPLQVSDKTLFALIGQHLHERDPRGIVDANSHPMLR